MRAQAAFQLMLVASILIGATALFAWEFNKIQGRAAIGIRGLDGRMNADAYCGIGIEMALKAKHSSIPLREGLREVKCNPIWRGAANGRGMEFG